MRYLVVGVNGVGKSTLLAEVGKRTGIPVLHMTSLLVQHMGMPLDYDRLRAMDQNFTLKEWEVVAAELARKYDSYLLDGHIMNMTEGRVYPRVGNWIGLQDALVMLKARPETILRRLNPDKSHHRDLFAPILHESHKLAVLEDYQVQTEALFMHLAAQYQLPAKVISIEDLEAAAAELEQFIRSLTS